MIKGKIILGVVASTPLLSVAATTTTLSNNDNRIFLKDDASIAGMKIWKMEKDLNGKQLSADDSYYGVIVPIGTNIREDTIKSLFKDSINLQVNFETSFQKDKEGTFNIKIQKDRTKIKMKIFVMDKIWTNEVKFENVKLPEEFAIPEGVTSIGDHAFWGTVLNNSFKIPERVKSIGDGAFDSAALNNSFKIPERVKSIGDRVFAAAILNDSFKIPERVTSIGDHAFHHTKLNNSFKIPERVKSIGNYAFKHATLNDSFEISKRVTSIGDGAFAFVVLNNGFSIPERVTSIANHAFKQATLNDNFAIPKKVTSIGDHAFQRAVLNDSFAIPKMVKSIGDYAFAAVALNDSFSLPKRITNIGDGAFAFAALNNGFSIPERVTTIGYSAFENTNFAKLNGQKLKINFSTKVNKDPGLIFKEKQGKAQNAEWVYSSDQLWNDLKLKTPKYEFKYKNIPPSQIIKPEKEITTTDRITINFKDWQANDHNEKITWRATLKKEGDYSLDISGNFNVALKKLLDEKNHAQTLVDNIAIPQQDDANHDVNLFKEIQKAKTDAIKAIKNASTIEGVKALASSATEGSEVLKIKSVINAYNASTGEMQVKNPPLKIHPKNDQKTETDLSKAQTIAIQAIDKITGKETPVDGATLPSTEKVAFDNAVTDAKKAIQNTTSIADVREAQTDWTTTVTAKRDALDQAIKSANDQKTETDLSNAKAIAKQAIDKITAKETLVDGVTIPSAEQTAFDNAVTDAKKAIQNATSIADVREAQTDWTTTVTAKRDALDQAIKSANDQKTETDLSNAKAIAKQAIDKITGKETPVDGATLPSTEKVAFDNAVTDAKKAIQNTTSIADVREAQTDWTTTVTAKRDALDQAIKSANDQKTETDLSNAKAIAKQAIDKITAKETPVDGVTIPSAEKAAFDNAVTDAKKAIQNTTSIADVREAQTDWTTTVTAKRDALDQAIKSANDQKTETDLSNAKAIAKQAIDKITAKETPVDGVTIPSAEKAAFDNAVTDAKKAIQNTTSIADVREAQTDWTTTVTAKRDALDQAIKSANDQKTETDLSNAKAIAKQAIVKITAKETPVDGVTIPSKEQTAFDNAVADAKKAIQNTTSIADVKKLQTDWTTTVTAKRDALDQAIKSANDQKTETDLSNAKAIAKQAIDKITGKETPVDGATLPSTEKAAFDNAVTDAKKAIQNTTSIADVREAQTDWTTTVTAKRDALDQAIKSANDQNSKKILNKKHLSKTSIVLFTIGSIFGLVVLVYTGSIVWKKYKIKN